MSRPKPTVYLDFADFHPWFVKTDNFFYHLLSERFDVRISDHPEFLIYSHGGHHHKLHACVKVYYTVESFAPDFDECDYAFTCRELEDPRHLRFPHYILYGTPESIMKDGLDLPKVLAAKTRFCSFIVSNPNLRKTRKRVDFFHRLSRYKQVDSGGKVLNNIGHTVDGLWAGKVEFLRAYKFTIAFENKSLPGYTTEKLFHAMQATCLPIYWGNPHVDREFNTRSFLNYFDFPSEEALIEKIIELDRDDAKYLECLREPYFHNNQPNEFFSRERILDQFERIFSTRVAPVARRRTWVFFGRWTVAKRDKPNA
jgi:hypothetical protein